MMLERRNNTSRVLSAIVKRARIGDEPGNRSDGLRVGLVIEAGAMDAVTAGMAAGLLAVGAGDAFEGLHTPSAASIVGGYFLAKQPWGSDVFQRISNEEFLDYGRFPKSFAKEYVLGKAGSSRPALDTRFLIHNVMRNQQPLDLGAVMNSATRLHLYATDARSASIRSFDQYDGDEEQFLERLRINCQIPILAGMPESDGNGGMLTHGSTFVGALALRQALGEFTDILVLRGTPENSWRGQIDSGERIVQLLMMMKYPRFARHYLDGYKEYDRALAIIKMAKNDQLVNGVRIHSIVPPEGTRVIPPLLLDGEARRLQSQHGFKLVVNAFKGYGLEINNDFFPR